MEYKMKCKDCKASAWCRHTFGKYYSEKSNWGEGCSTPLPQDAATIAKHMKYVLKVPF